MPFVTEEIWSYHPARRGHLAVHPFPEPDESLLDPDAEDDVEAGIELTRRLRAWRDLVEVPVASVLPARVDGVEPQEFVGRLARFEFGEDGGDPIASVGPVRVLASEELDAEAVAGAAREAPRGAARRGRARRAQARQRGLRRQGARRRWSRRSAASSSATAPSCRSSSEYDPEAYLDSLEPIGWKLGLERMHKLTTRCWGCPSTASPRSTWSAPTASPR